MSFNVALLIRADSSQARAELAGLASALPRVGQGGVQAAQGTRTLSEATARLERSARSTTATAALFPPVADRMAGSTTRAARAAAGLPVPLRESERALRAASQAGAALGQVVNNLPPRVSGLVNLLVRFGPAAAAAGLATAALVGTTARGVRAFAEYERQMLTTEQVIRATGGAAGRTAQDIDRLSRDIGRSTLAATVGVREAAAQVLTFRSITGETFDRTLRLAQDLSAVGFGSISQSAMQLAKALEDPEQGLSALRRVGVSFSATQMELIRNFTETGRVAEAQGLILAQVEKQVGGAGVAAAGGLAGAFDTLTEETGRWFELVGSRAAELIGLRERLLGVAEAVAALNEGMDPGAETQARTMRQSARHLLELRAELERLEADPRTIADPLLTAGQRADLEARIAQERANLDTLLQMTRDAAEERADIEAQALETIAEADREKVEAVIAGLQREIDMLGLTELQRAQDAALKRAGVTLAQEEGRAVAALVEQQFRLQKARQATSMLAELQQEAQIREAIQRYGEDSVEVARLREEAERAVFEQQLESLGASEEMTAALREAWEAARGLAGTNMAGGIAAARAEAQAMANEILRAVGAAQSLANQGISSLRESQLRLDYADNPVGLSGELARERMRAAQGVRRDGAEGGELAALDAEVEAYARNMEAIERNNQARQALNQTRSAAGAASRAAAGGAQAESDAISQLIESLRLELTLLNETDPVQRELLRHREALATATDTERQMVEELIAARLRDEAAASALADRAQMYGNMVASALDQLIVQSKSADEVVKGLIRTLLQATIQAAIFGSGPLGGLFGGVGIFGGAARKAGGGEIVGPGTGTSDSVPIWASNGEYIVNARAAQANLPILEAINSGQGLPRFARGGRVGGGGGVMGAGGSMGSEAPGATAAPQFNIDVKGARGNREIEEAVARGVEAGLKQYDAYVLPRSFARIYGDRRRIG